MIKLKEILKEAKKEPSSISAKSALSVAILKKAFAEESPKTKYVIRNKNFEFDFKSFCKNFHDVGIDEDKAIRKFFMPIAQTIKIIDDWISTEDVIFISDVYEDYTDIAE